MAQSAISKKASKLSRPLTKAAPKQFQPGVKNTGGSKLIKGSKVKK